MFEFLLVTSEKNALSALASALEKHDDTHLSWAESGSKALSMVSDTPVDLLITDEKLEDMTGLELATRLLSINPMINCAAVSTLSPEKFHVASEGLGLMAQLSSNPSAEEAKKLFSHLKDIKDIQAGMND